MDRTAILAVVIVLLVITTFYQLGEASNTKEYQHRNLLIFISVVGLVATATILKEERNREGGIRLLLALKLVLCIGCIAVASMPEVFNNWVAQIPEGFFNYFKLPMLGIIALYEILIYEKPEGETSMFVE